jgi:hypothetical protein
MLKMYTFGEARVRMSELGKTRRLTDIFGGTCGLRTRGMSQDHDEQAAGEEILIPVGAS